jgi:hypothetical protein
MRRRQSVSIKGRTLNIERPTSKVIIRTGSLSDVLQNAIANGNPATDLAEKGHVAKTGYKTSDAPVIDQPTHKDLAKVLPHYYRGVQFLTDNGVPPTSPMACRVNLCQQLTSSKKRGESLDAASGNWQNKVLSATPPKKRNR